MAADAIVNGDAGKLKRLLRENPTLVRARSTREHGATLLHYTSANGVEGYRQKTPKNIVEITKCCWVGRRCPRGLPRLRQRLHHAGPDGHQHSSGEQGNDGRTPATAVGPRR